MKKDRPNSLNWQVKYWLSDHIFLPMRLKKKNSEIPMTPRQKLSVEEKKKVKDLLGPLCQKSTIRCYEFYKGYGCGFSELYSPNDFYFLAECLMNKTWANSFLSHKCCLKYFIPKKNRPLTIVQNIDGHLMDMNDEIISIDQAIGLLEDAKVFFYKNAINTGGGVGVYKVDVDKIIGNKSDYFKELLDGKDFIVQSPVKQSRTMSQFNSSSVNTIRVLSLNLYNRCTILSSFIRMGGKGSVVDNLHGNSGGVLVGIDDKGNLSPWGINQYYEKQDQAPSGVMFQGITINAYNSVKDFVISAHKNIKEVNLIGWDIAIDENDNPIVIEINLGSADIAAHQVFNGPVFGERTAEVIDYVKDNLKDIRLSL